MPRLLDRALAEEARVAAGFSDPEWRRFIRQVLFNEKRRITESINARLIEEGIPMIEIELVGWRMSRVIGNLRHAEARSNKSLATPPETDVATNGTDTDVGTTATMATATPASSSATGTRTFNPIRDI
ncbi:uncharacterized protein SETTUDRAFT_160980 [Exserohilum turcica Et28A]|uniref:Uncharacterized protein n=1 Tax=Exserohilum turcicum (strain 28A) TaxID=671987 RepID=R0ISC9_EXST2|nr:uncharacterized protein SETTUDRAFT_160980 [Exserohilum turcica Et28A]EOA87745.1 hypothetical protein SETTUDRAFT_160980 [Exserohilum turcica Et28A]